MRRRPSNTRLPRIKGIQLRSRVRKGDVRIRERQRRDRTRRKRPLTDDVDVVAGGVALVHRIRVIPKPRPVSTHVQVARARRIKRRIQGKVPPLTILHPIRPIPLPMHVNVRRRIRHRHRPPSLGSIRCRNRRQHQRHPIHRRRHWRARRPRMPIHPHRVRRRHLTRHMRHHNRRRRRRRIHTLRQHHLRRRHTTRQHHRRTTIHRVRRRPRRKHRHHMRRRPSNTPLPRDVGIELCISERDVRIGQRETRQAVRLRHDPVSRRRSGPHRPRGGERRHDECGNRDARENQQRN